MIGLHVPENTHHLRTQIVGAYGKESVLDAFHHYLRRAYKAEPLSFVGLLGLGIFASVDTHRRVVAARIGDLHLEVFVVDIERYTLIGKLAEQLHDAAGVEAEGAFAFSACHVEARHQ